MEPVLQIGKDGITDNLVKQCWDALEARELIKVNVQKNAPYAAREACEALLRARARRTGSDASAIDSRFTVRRASIQKSAWRISKKSKGLQIGAYDRFAVSFSRASRVHGFRFQRNAGKEQSAQRENEIHRPPCGDVKQEQRHSP